MLFPYKNISHDMEKMHKFIERIFFDVWCMAPSTQYGIHLFAANADLYELMERLFQKDLAGKLDGSGEYFYVALNEIYQEFKSLSVAEIQEYTNHFYANNDIENACSRNDACIPVTFASLNATKQSLNQKLEDFFKNLYSSGFLDLKNTVGKIGSLTDYYKEFVKENDEGVCPFCGLLPIDGEFDPTREAFDHYLPKSKYPFNSINLKNLAPSCNKCNSGNKRDKDPLHDDAGNRRKAFYPFSTAHTGIEVTVSIAHKNWSDLKDGDVVINFGPIGMAEEIGTWKELYRVDQRYVAKCCYRNGGVSWLNRVFDECQNYKLTPAEMLKAELETASMAPWIEMRFLKKAFLEGCDRAGLFT